MSTQKAYDYSSSLTHFYANLPPKPYCADDLASGLSIRPIKTAIQRSHIQPNDPHNVRWLVFDIDLGADSAHRWADKDTAEPNLIVQNPANLNCHYLYNLSVPVWTNGTGKQAPAAYLSSIKSAMTDQLGADSRYSGLICKNPLHSAWRTSELHSRTHSLHDLAKYLDLSASSSIDRARARAEQRFNSESISGRNDHLFETLRLFAYDRSVQYFDMIPILGRDKAYGMWSNAINAEAMRINSEFSSALSLNEVRTTAKSIYNWVWINYRVGDKANRGKMGFGETRHNYNKDIDRLSDDERRRRQSLSAELTNKHRKESTELKIKQSIERLNVSGDKITKAKVARMTGISRTQISMQYSHFFE